MSTKNFKFIIAVLFTIVPVFTNAQMFQQWVYRYDGSAHHTEYITVNGSVIDAAGNVYVACTGNNVNTGMDIVIMKFLPNSPGIPAMITGYSTSGGEMANAIALDNAGNIYVTGQRSTNNNWDLIILKFNSVGQIQWAGQFIGPYGGDDYATCMALDAFGNVIVAGKTYISGLNSDYLVIKYSPSGVTQWIRTYDGPSDNNDQDEANAIACDAFGNVVVTGKAGWTNAKYDVVNVKYNASGVAGATRYDGAEHKDDVGKKVVFDSQGNFYVTAATIESGDNPEITTMKFSSSNVPLWVKHYDFASDSPNDMKIDASGSVYVAGTSSGNGNGTDFVTIKYNTNGTQQWAARSNEGDYAQSLALDGSNNVYVTGYANSDIVTVKYNTFGVEIGTPVFYGLSGIDYGLTILPSSNGSAVYVAGWSFGTSSYDVVLIKYTQFVGINTNNPEIPDKFSLEQNFPNPFNPSTTIRFSLPAEDNVKLKVFDITGKEVAVLVNETVKAGNYEIIFDASELSSGTYFYKIETSGFTQIKKMVLVK